MTILKFPSFQPGWLRLKFQNDVSNSIPGSPSLPGAEQNSAGAALPVRKTAPGGEPQLRQQPQRIFSIDLAEDMIGQIQAIDIPPPLP